MNFSSQADPAREIGSGFSELDSGLRLGYQFSRPENRVTHTLDSQRCPARPELRQSVGRPLASSA
jgi:hypothetical protein